MLPAVIGYQRVLQAISLTVFLGALMAAGFKGLPGTSANLFLRMDPLIGIGTILAARDLVADLWPALLTVILAIRSGRFFCGYIWPVGTTVDVLGRIVKAPERAGRKNTSVEAMARYRPWKYLLLVLILAAAAGGVSLVHLGSPLSWATRLYALCLFPIAALISDTALYWGGDLLSMVGWYDLIYYQIDLDQFAVNFLLFAVLLGLAVSAYAQPRFWCRHVCPAGALLGLFSRAPLVSRTVDDSCTGCGICIRKCPGAAIYEDPTKTAHSECLVCLKCIDVCPESAISFDTSGSRAVGWVGGVDPTRRSIVLASAVGLLGAGVLRTGLGRASEPGTDHGIRDGELIRPPGALPERTFSARCVRCGECMTACPTNTLQPMWFKAGLDGIFSPVITPRLGPCDVRCTRCGRVCPTGAIRRLTVHEKRHAKVGTAWIVRQNCLAWEQDRKCLVCDEVCPYNAIAFRPVKGRRNLAPFVLENRCSGCGRCEHKCPVHGTSAIRVNVMGEIRLASGSYVTKAREMGLVFKPKDHGLDRMAPDVYGVGTGRPGRPAGDGDEPSPVKPSTPGIEGW